MTAIYLIRHGEIPVAEPHRFIGRQNLCLNENGREQMNRLAHFLANRTIDRMICSPLDRCRQSAAILSETLNTKAEVCPELAEIDLGSWEGLTRTEVEERFPGQHAARGRDIAHFRPEQGESFADLLIRAWPAFDMLTSAEQGTIAIVTHAGVNRVLLCRILGMPLANVFRLNQAYGCVNIVYRNTKGFRVEALNCLPAQ